MRREAMLDAAKSNLYGERVRLDRRTDQLLEAGVFALIVIADVLVNETKIGGALHPDTPRQVAVLEK